MKKYRTRDFNYNFSNIENIIKELEKDYKLYKKETTKFLEECHKFGIKKISVGTNSKEIEECKSWPFDYEGNVFAGGNVDFNGHPAIWKVLENIKISGSVGNGYQHVLNDEARLIEGVYEFKNGKWRDIN